MKKAYRIKKNQEFSALISRGKRTVNSSFALYYAKKQKSDARIGISVSKKLGIAVRRNLIKRQLRMMLSETVDFPTFAYDAIVIVRSGYLKADYAENRKRLEKLLKNCKIKEN